LNSHILCSRLRLAGGVALILLVGCTPPSDVERRRNRAESAAPETSDNLQLAMQFLSFSDELDAERARAQCAYHLNRWLEVQEPADDWLADPLFSRLPQEIRGDHTPTTLGRLRFNLEDVRYVQQNQWQRQVAQWVSRQPAPRYLEQWLATNPTGLAEEDMERLVAAERFFDWTIRNVQLETLLEYPTGETAGPSADATSGDESERDAGATSDTAGKLPPPARGEPGPGYLYYPWQVMLYGRGDAWQRGRVFIQLCRQQQIPAVMLAIDDPSLRPTPQPWLPAVLLGDQLYLFDTHLGLPLRGPGGEGIASLQQVRQDPALLEDLDVGSKYQYPVRSDDLNKVVALIDASPAALSQRMAMVESQLAGENQVVLTVSPSSLSRRLADVAGLSATRLWRVPFEVDLFRRALPARLQDSPEMARKYFRQEVMYDGSHPLVVGRRRAFQGEFETVDDKPGAKALYLQARVPDSVIEDLASNPQVLAEMGVPVPEDPAQRQALLATTELRLRDAKLTASLWLGIAQYETDQFTDAVEWLDEKTLQADTEERWSGAARYNLGRSYEALGSYEQAREVYYADQSPQAHGNRLRARYFPQDGSQ
jgi:tetratricopeptide (TPR) repeat protein